MGEEFCRSFKLGFAERRRALRLAVSPLPRSLPILIRKMWNSDSANSSYITWTESSRRSSRSSVNGFSRHLLALRFKTQNYGKTFCLLLWQPVCKKKEESHLGDSPIIRVHLLCISIVFMDEGCHPLLIIFRGVDWLNRVNPTHIALLDWMRYTLTSLVNLSPTLFVRLWFLLPFPTREGVGG